MKCPWCKGEIEIESQTVVKKVVSKPSKTKEVKANPTEKPKAKGKKTK